MRSRFSRRGCAPTRSFAPTKSEGIDGSLPAAPLLREAYNHPVSLLQPFDHLGMVAVADAGFDLDRFGDDAFRCAGRLSPGRGNVNRPFGLALFLLFLAG